MGVREHRMSIFLLPHGAYRPSRWVGVHLNRARRLVGANHAPATLSPFRAEVDELKRNDQPVLRAIEELGHQAA